MKQLKLFKIGIAVFLCVFSLNAMCQDGDTLEIQRSLISKKIVFGRFSSTANENRKLQNGVTFLKSVLRAKTDDDLRCIKSETDEIGYTHQKYQQYYKGIKVEGAEYLLHSKGGNIHTINGLFADVKLTDVRPKIDSTKALSTVLKIINAKKYKWQTKGDEHYPRAELVICKESSNENWHLAWKYCVLALDPLMAENVYIDASTSEIINRVSLIQDANSTGTASTTYSSTQTITTDAISNGYRLSEVENGVTIQTMNFLHNSDQTNTSVSVDFVDNDNNWTANEWNNANHDNAAIDAHWGAEKVYNYWLSVFNRNSLNGNGLAIKSYVHFGNGYDNAFWYSSTNSMYYGDGSAIFKPLVALDVCAHEFGHGICQYTANLAYQGESGALNEGFSDIWGACIEAWAAPTKQRWLIGEDIMINKTALRSMSNPKQYNQPDTYNGTNWISQSGCSPSPANDYCGVHTNSGVLSKWFYLLSDGGSGTNDIGNTYYVNGVGITAAQKIAYRAESLYLNSSADYSAARNATIQAATDLASSIPNAVSEVTNAWYAVGVGAQYQYTISGPSQVCDQGTYTINNLPAGATVVWSATPSGIVSLQQNGNSVTLTKVGGGKITLSAAINNSFTIKKSNIQVGTVVPPFNLYRGTSGVSYGVVGVNYTFKAYGATTSTNDLDYYWTVTPPNLEDDFPSEFGGLEFDYMASTPGDYIVTLSCNGACGWSDPVTKVFNFRESGLAFTLSPNPSSNTTTINMTSPANASASTLLSASESSGFSTSYSVKVLDAYGSVVYMGTKQGKQFTISTSSFRNGVYAVTVSDGTNTYQNKLIIKH